ncbi:MAG: helix-turn-helix transcriptional regulator [Clostridia bacterium]|nr:helix-turn-helix transcriptional regulator [Clostridia bacterium]
MIYIGENIKRLRRERELTQETLADFLGVTFQSVSKWERGESYPDITFLPSIASFFDVSYDELLGFDETFKEKKVQEYIDEYNNMRLKDSPYVYEMMSRAVKEFPGEFRLLVRYLEMLIATKSNTNSDSELILEEVEKIYGNIIRYCTNDTIRMWAKRLVCMYYNTLCYKTKKEKYTEKTREMAKEMPKMTDSGDYIMTIINLPDDEHYAACDEALENEILLLMGTVNNKIHYKKKFSTEYEIEAKEKLVKMVEMFYDDGNYGKCYRSMIYALGDLGRLYFEIGDEANALKYLEKCATQAVKHDGMPEETKLGSLIMEGHVYKKTKYGKTMSERMKDRFENSYNLSDEFKASKEFVKIIDILG